MTEAQAIKVLKQHEYVPGATTDRGKPLYSTDGIEEPARSEIKAACLVLKRAGRRVTVEEILGKPAAKAASKE